MTANRPNKVQIEYFSDVLCVWAYVAQARLDELITNLHDDIDVGCGYLAIFGDAHNKLETAWKDRGGLAGYSKHVQEVVARFGHVQVHPEVWTRATPRSSLPVHLFLHAIELAEKDGVFPEHSAHRAAWTVRQMFFKDAIDISLQSEQRSAAERCDLDWALIESRLSSGAAHAAMCADLQRASGYGIHVSPSFVFNEGRQRLVGNVGYRIIEANVRELLREPSTQQSWC
ncbi:MAG: DsbA family protein [Polyangiales bacterium]